MDASRAELNQQLAAAKEFRSGLHSRRQLLADLDAQLEGVDAGVRELLHQKEQDPTRQSWACVRGMVADLISTHFSNAVLIETALNGYDQYLVVEDSQEFFRQTLRAGFAVLDAARGSRLRSLILDVRTGAAHNFGPYGFTTEALRVRAARRWRDLADAIVRGDGDEADRQAQLTHVDSLTAALEVTAQIVDNL